MPRTIEERVLEVFSEMLFEEVGPDLSFNDLFMDQLDKVEIAMGIEEEFDIAIHDEHWDEMVSVSDVINLITNLI